MLKLLLSLALLTSINAHSQTNKLILQSDILTANALTIFASAPPADRFQNITSALIASGAVHSQFVLNPSIESQQAIKELVVDKTNSLITNKEGTVFNLYRYNNEIKVLTFQK